MDLESLENQDGYWELYYGLTYNPQSFSIKDVVHIDAFWTDNQDEPSFDWLVRLKTGEWVAVTGGHDYTGWACQSSLSSSIHKTREDAIRWGLTLNARENLGLLLPEES